MDQISGYGKRLFNLHEGFCQSKIILSSVSSRTAVNHDYSLDRDPQPVPDHR
jgi:hypothetical protein